MNWLQPRRFTLLLAAIGLLLVAYPLVRHFAEGRVLFDVLLGLVFLAVFLGVFRQGGYRWLAVVLGIPAIVGNWLDQAVPSENRILFIDGFHLCATLFMMYAIVMVVLTVYREPVVTVDGVCGVFCGYLLLGLAFTHIYCVLESVWPGSFPALRERLGDSIDHRHARFFMLTWFSFGALTTAGSGNLTAGTDQARSLALVETILGQFYMAGLIAELIGRRVSQVSLQPASRGASSSIASPLV